MRSQIHRADRAHRAAAEPAAGRLAGAPRPARALELAGALAAAGRAVRRALAAIVGAPDYERYVAHVRRRHPGRTPETRDEFSREQMRRRYERPGSRCC